MLRSNATGYIVKRGTSAAGPFTQIGTTATNSYTDTTVASGVTYYYVVVAANADNQSVESASTSATSSGDGIWTAASAGDWSAAGNWQDGTIAVGTDRNATFSQAADVTVNQNISGLTLGALAFSNANTTITGNALTLDVTTGTPVVSVAGSVTATIASALAGTDGLTKSDTGTLVLNAGSGDNNPISYVQNISGGLNINAGTVTLASQKIRFGSVTIGSGGTLKASASWATGASNPWFNGASVGAITVNAGGTLTANAPPTASWKV